MMVALAVTYRL